MCCREWDPISLVLAGESIAQGTPRSWDVLQHPGGDGLHPEEGGDGWHGIPGGQSGHSPLLWFLGGELWRWLSSYTCGLVCIACILDGTAGILWMREEGQSGPWGGLEGEGRDPVGDVESSGTQRGRQ